MSRGGVIIERVFAPGVSVAAWARALSGWVSAGEPGRVLKCDGPNVVIAARLLGRGVVVKRWRPSAWTRFRSRISGSKSERHWRGAAWLARHGIDTAPCLAMGHDAALAARRDYLVMEELTGPTALEVLARSADARTIGVREELAIAREVGRQIARMIAHGRFNRDHKPSNLIVAWRGGRVKLAVIDCVAILPVWRAGGAGGARERMLASLCIEPIEVGVGPRRSLVLAALRSALGLERTVRGAVGSGGERLGARTALRLNPAAKHALRGLWRSVSARVRAQGGSARG